MVYEGKPSQGCGTCRKRRIKCDQQRPTCGQCIKSKRTCLGYRNQAELTFVSLNKTLQGKGTSKGKQRALASRDAASESDSASGGAFVVPKPLTETIERQALSYFFSEFVALPCHQESARGFIECLLPIYSDARKESPLFDATSAVALASFSNKHQSRRLRVNSHIYYGKAVAALQEAIADSTLARANETLMSILILGLFEAVTASEESFFEWGHHVDGAAALVQYRGTEEMFASPVSFKLYWSVRAQAVYSNVIKNEPLEPYRDWETLWLKPVEIIKGHSYHLTSLNARVPALRAAAAKWLRAPMSGTVAMKCVDIIGNAKVLDQLIASWAFEVPTIWRPSTIGHVEGTLTDPEETFLYPGNMDTYYDLWVGAIWNAWRAMRIVCNMLVINCLERLLPPEQLQGCPEYQIALATVQSMADGLCASVPYHLGHPMPRFEDSGNVDLHSAEKMSLDDTDQPRLRVDHTETERSVKSLGSFYILLPILFAFSAPTLRESQRAWLRGRLLHIASVQGSRQSRMMADLSPINNNDGRTETVSDFSPPPYEPYPDIFELVHSSSFRNLERIADLQATTAESRVFRAWRSGFIERLLDM